MHSFDANSQRYHIVYDDGDEEKTLDFGKEKILLPLWDIKKIKLDRRGGLGTVPEKYRSRLSSWIFPRPRMFEIIIYHSSP